MVLAAVRSWAISELPCWIETETKEESNETIRAGLDWSTCYEMVPNTDNEIHEDVARGAHGEIPVPISSGNDNNSWYSLGSRTDLDDSHVGILVA